MDEEANLIEIFRQEAYDHLNNIEDALLDMEQNPNDQESIHRLFRAMHTIKGSGAMFGFDAIADFAHHAETVMDKVREGAIPVTSELIGVILTVKDHIKTMLDLGGTGNDIDPGLYDKIVNLLQNFLPESESAPSPESFINTVTSSDHGKETVYRIRLCPNPEIMITGMEPRLILIDLQELGELEISVNTDKVPQLMTLEPEKIFLSWDIYLTSSQGLNAVEDVFIFIQDDSDISIQPLKYEEQMDEEFRPRLGEILVDRGDVSEENVHTILKNQKRLGQMLVESGEISEKIVESALLEQKIVKKRKFGAGMEGIRIPPDKLDKLINLVGELVTTQAHMNHLTEGQKDSVFAAPVKQMDRLSSDLRKFALDMRMLPVGTLFNRFRRLVRDLSYELKKEIDLVVEGGETELDKSILEKLHDPLVHLIRNSIDHGIMTPEKREWHGKPRKGMIRLAAAHRGANVNITIADDGMGINSESVRKKAVAKGLISKDSVLTDTEIHDLLFMPGFSTSTAVTDVSGRGVGMDVVKREINALSGSIRIVSVHGRGTAFHLSLPLTLAIIEGLHVRVDGRNFIIPVSQVEKCGELNRLCQEQSGDRDMLRFKGELIPFIRLREFFRISGDIRHVEHIATIKTGHDRIGIVVDEILGNIQTVIKPLDPFYRLAKGISGASVMGDGAVALIIDFSEIVRCVKKEKLQSPNNFSLQ